jgi:hypothetical protein
MLPKVLVCGIIITIPHTIPHYYYDPHIRYHIIITIPHTIPHYYYEPLVLRTIINYQPSLWHIASSSPTRTPAPPCKRGVGSKAAASAAAPPLPPLAAAGKLRSGPETCVRRLACTTVRPHREHVAMTNAQWATSDGPLTTIRIRVCHGNPMCACMSCVCATHPQGHAAAAAPSG